MNELTNKSDGMRFRCLLLIQAVLLTSLFVKMTKAEAKQSGTEDAKTSTSQAIDRALPSLAAGCGKPNPAE